MSEPPGPSTTQHKTYSSIAYATGGTFKVCQIALSYLMVTPAAITGITQDGVTFVIV
ncbi:hypothetical protein ACFLZU_06000 [Thermodesulfobacteriota bacterium]